MGQPIESLIPERFRAIHPHHRKEYNTHPRTRQMGIGLELHGRRKDGTEFPVDIMLSPVETPGGQNRAQRDSRSFGKEASRGGVGTREHEKTLSRRGTQYRPQL